MENHMDDKIDEQLILDGDNIGFPGQEKILEKKSPLIKIVAIVFVLIFMFGGLIVVLASIGII